MKEGGSIKTRVAIFTKDLRGGGAERVVMHLARGLVEMGDIALDIIVCNAEGPNLKLVPDGARLIDLTAARMLFSLRGLTEYIRRENPAAIISALDHANITAIVARSLARSNAKLLISVHNNLSHVLRGKVPLRKKLELPLMRVFYPKADLIVAVSTGVADDLAKVSGIARRNIAVIYNPVVTDDLYTKSKEQLSHPWFEPRQPPVVLNVGRLTYQKNQRMLLQAFHKLRANCPARLMILGEGEERPNLERFALQLGLKLGLDGDVLLPGFVDNPYSYMSRAAVFALSSRYEGLPTVLIEALACGASIVSTDCPSGPSEILRGGKLGKLTHVSDPNKFADALREMLYTEKPLELPSWAPYTTSVAASAYRKLLNV